MKATGIVRRIDDLGRVVIPKEIRRTMRIREGDPTLTTLTHVARFVHALMDLSQGFSALAERRVAPAVPPRRTIAAWWGTWLLFASYRYGRSHRCHRDRRRTHGEGIFRQVACILQRGGIDPRGRMTLAGHG